MDFDTVLPSIEDEAEGILSYYSNSGMFTYHTSVHSILQVASRTWVWVRWKVSKRKDGFVVISVLENILVQECLGPKYSGLNVIFIFFLFRK